MLKLEGVSADIAAQVEVIMNGGSPDQFAVQSRRHSFWSRVLLDDAIVAGQDIQFFATDPSTYGSNWNGGLPNNQVFIAQTLRFSLQRGYALDGTADADTDPYDAGVTAATSWADSVQIIDNGLVNLNINERQVVQNQYGLSNFPAGGGASGPIVAASTASTVTYTAGTVTNGEPHNGNAWIFEPWQIVAPKEDVSLTVKYPFNRTLTGKFVLMASLHGVFVTPAKR